MYILNLCYSNYDSFSKLQTDVDVIGRQKHLQYLDYIPHKEVIDNLSTTQRLGDTLVPLKMHDIRYNFNWVHFQQLRNGEEYHFDTQAVADILEAYYTHCTQDINILFADIESHIDGFNTTVTEIASKDNFKDIYKKVPEVVQGLFDKVPMVQVGNTYQHKTAVYISKDEKSLIVFYKSESDSYLNGYSDGIVTLTLGVLPILFTNVKKQLTDLEKSYFEVLIKQAHLRRRDLLVLREAFIQLAETPEYKKQLENLRLAAFLDNYTTRRRNALQNNIYDYQQKIERLMSDYNRLMQSLNEAQHDLSYIDDTNDTMLETIKDILNKPYIVSFDINDNYILFNIITNLELCIEEEAEHMINDWYNKGRITEIQKQLLLDIFINKTVQLKAISTFKFKYANIQNNNIDLVESPNLNYHELNAITNPHLSYYNCTGNYKMSLTKAVVEQDLIAFINIALASAKTINFLDSMVMNRFREILFDTNCTAKCIIDEEGKAYTYKEYLKSKTVENTEED